MADDERESLRIKELAEAEKSRLEGQATMLLAEAEAEKFRAETRKLEAETLTTELRYVREQRTEAEELAGNKYHFLYNFSSGVDNATVASCITQLTTWSRQSPGCPIEIVFHSPGGAVLPGMALFDFIQHLRSQGHHITTTALGVAASMAGILLQAGDTRVMGAESWVLIHQAQFGAIGSYGQVEDTFEWIKRIQKRIVNIFAARSKLSIRQIERNWQRKDWWLSSDECLKLGVVDEVR
jgi:ATP-dependent Clp protease, protease subunit